MRVHDAQHQLAGVQDWLFPAQFCSHHPKHDAVLSPGDMMWKWRMSCIATEGNMKSRSRFSGIDFRIWTSTCYFLFDRYSDCYSFFHVLFPLLPIRLPISPQYGPPCFFCVQTPRQLCISIGIHIYYFTFWIFHFLQNFLQLLPSFTNTLKDISLIWALSNIITTICSVISLLMAIYFPI